MLVSILKVVTVTTSQNKFSTSKMALFSSEVAGYVYNPKDNIPGEK